MKRYRLIYNVYEIPMVNHKTVKISRVSPKYIGTVDITKRDGVIEHSIHTPGYVMDTRCKADIEVIKHLLYRKDVISEKLSIDRSMCYISHITECERSGVYIESSETLDSISGYIQFLLYEKNSFGDLLKVYGISIIKCEVLNPHLVEEPVENTRSIVLKSNKLYAVDYRELNSDNHAEYVILFNNLDDADEYIRKSLWEKSRRYVEKDKYSVNINKLTREECNKISIPCISCYVLTRAEDKNIIDTEYFIIRRCMTGGADI